MFFREMGNAPQHHEKGKMLASSDGKSYTSSDVMFRGRDHQSSSSSVMFDNQHIQAQLKMPTEHSQQQANLPVHGVQPYIVNGKMFQDKAALPTMAFPGSDFQSGPRLQRFNIQHPSEKTGPRGSF